MRTSVIHPLEHERRTIVWLLWVYLLLLVGEGALRKWILPGWSDALLIVRDPVALAILALAYRSGLFVAAAPLRMFVIMTVSFAALMLIQIVATDGVNPAILLFGLRTYCLHLPLIFVMGRVLTGRDLRAMALAILVLMVPIAMLMVQQFFADPGDWINTGAGEGRLQLRSALGHIRPPGPFSFISGPVFFYALALACLLGAEFARGRDLLLARWAGWIALVVAAAVSGSRALFVGLVPVLAGVLITAVLRPQVAGRFVRSAVVACFVVACVWSSAIVEDGREVLSARLSETAAAENLLTRSTSAYTASIGAWSDAPLFGYGLGIGTNAASALRGAATFQLGEDEWTRVLYEAGPMFGLAYIAWRVLLCVWLVRLALGAAARGFVLPMLCLGACVTNVASGNWGQPTTQGFAVFGAGFTLAACQVSCLAAALQRQPAGGQPMPGLTGDARLRVAANSLEGIS